MITAIQGILGASKRQPHLATLVRPDEPNTIHFMFGAECLLSYDRDDLCTRNALMGMLCSAGVRLVDVARVFGVDPRQARRYGRVFEQEGLAALASAVPGRPRKVTPAIEAFVEARFRVLFGQRRRGFRDVLRAEVLEAFGVSLGYERVRQITKPIREELEAGDGGSARVPVPAPGAEVVAEAPEAEDAPWGVPPERLRRGFYTRYAGGLVLSVLLGKLLEGTAEVVGEGLREVFRTFASMVMHMVAFGCVNLERAKGLVRREFGVLVGAAASPTLKTLRRWLARLAEGVESGQVQVALARNYLEHMAAGPSTFYIDGHFGPYTGQAALLLGYHPQGHCVVPGRTHYLVCDGDGMTVWFELEDESDDLREVIPRLVRRTQQVVVGSEERLTFVFDRGGYSRELFASFDTELGAYYVAWERYDTTDYSKHEVAWQAFDVELQGNHEHTPKVKRLWVGECPREVQVSAWGRKSPIRGHRKLLLRSARRPRKDGGRGYHIAPFLSNDPDASPESLARDLVRRWQQENEIKALCHGDGLDEITSYLTMGYEAVETQDPATFERVSAREIDNPRRKKLDKRHSTLARRVARLEERVARLKRDGRSSGHRRMRDARKRLETARAEREAVDARRQAEPQRVNQLAYLIEEGYERPDFSRKLLVDLLKICARNAQRGAEALLKKHYLNRRDHVTLLRRMVHAGGRVRLDASGVLRVRLERLNTEAEDEAFAGFLAEINALCPHTLGARSYPLALELRRKR